MRKISLVAVLAIAFTIPFPALAHAACTQSASVSNGSVTLCLSATKSSTTPSSSTKTATNVKTAKKVVFPATLVVKTTCPAIVTTSTAYAKTILSGCPAPKVVPAKVTVVKRVTTATKKATASATDSAAFTPNAVAIVSSAIDLQAGQSVTLSNTAITHTRTATILAKSAEVQFMPAAYRWYLDGVLISTAASVSMTLTAAGQPVVSLEVDYNAAYRYSSTAAYIYAGSITVNATLDLSVTAVPVVVTRPTPHLVSGTCAVRVSTYRC